MSVSLLFFFQQYAIWAFMPTRTKSVYTYVQSDTAHSANADVCVVTESWLSNDNVDRYSFEGYTQFYACRDGRRGGGVLVYAKDDLNPTPVRHFIVPDAMEILWLHLRPKRLPRQVSGLCVAAVYSPPNSTSDALLIDHVIDTIDQLKSKHLLQDLLGSRTITPGKLPPGKLSPKDNLTYLDLSLPHHLGDV